MEKFIKGIFVTVMSLCLLVNIVFFFSLFGRTQKVTENTYYVGTLSQADSEEEKYIFNVVYYANRDNSGIELFEIQCNGYTDYTMSDVYSYGYQVVNNSESEGISYSQIVDHKDNFFFFKDETTIYNECNGYEYFYNTSNGTSFEATANMEDGLFKFDIDGEVYAFEFLGKVKTAENWHSVTHTVNDFELFASLMFDVVKSLNECSNMTSTAVQIKDIFKVYKVDSSGVFTELPDTTYESKFINFNFTVYDKGATNYTQSMFGAIEHNTKFSLDGITENSAYFADQYYFTVDERDFDIEYNFETASATVKLKNSTIEYLKSFNNLVINVDFNTANLDYPYFSYHLAQNWNGGIAHNEVKGVI